MITATDFLIDGFLAAVAAIGFAAISNPPKKIFLLCGFVAAIGHSFRFLLISTLHMDIVVASFLSALFIGLLGVLFAYLVHCPSELFSYPALLPMIPGRIGYSALLGLIKYLNAESQSDHLYYLNLVAYNGIKAVLILFALCLGLAIPLFIFYRQSFKMSREYKSTSSVPTTRDL